MPEPSSTRFGLFNTEAHIFHSNCDNQDFQIGVWFPFSYASDKNRTYPVLYVPDGEFAYPLATGVIPTMMGNGDVPEMPVVGISYSGVNGWDEFGRLRDMDLCTQPFQSPPNQSRHAQYASFYRDELFPMIESRYRASPQDRALFGFSSAGFFALHMLFTQPGMFRRYVAASATWPGAGEYFLQCAQNYAAGSVHPPVDLYLSVGSLDQGQISGFEKLSETLRSGAYPNLRFTSQVFDGEGHSSGVMAKTFLSGVKAVFQENG